MTVQAATYESAQQGAMLLAGVAGQSIRIVAILATSWATASVQLFSMLGGQEPVNMTAVLHVGASRATFVKLGRECALVADAGRDVHVDTAYLSTVYPLSLMIWYERVPA